MEFKKIQAELAWDISVGSNNVILDMVDLEVLLLRTIMQPPPMIVSISGTNASCTVVFNATATIVVNDSVNNIISYLWSNTQTNSVATNLCGETNYSVTVTSNKGCTATGHYTPQSQSNLNITINSINPTCYGICNGRATAIVTGFTGSFTY